MSKRRLALLAAGACLLSACGEPATIEGSSTGDAGAPSTSPVVLGNEGETAPLPPDISDATTSSVISDPSTTSSGSGSPQIALIDEVSALLPALEVSAGLNRSELGRDALTVGDMELWLTTGDAGAVCVEFTRAESRGSVCAPPGSGLVSGGASTPTAPQESVVFFAFSNSVSAKAEAPCEVVAVDVAQSLRLAACDVDTFIGKFNVDFATATGEVFRTSITVADYVAMRSSGD